MPKPAWAADPNGRATTQHDEHVDGHQAELGAGRQADGEEPAPRRRPRRRVGGAEAQERVRLQELHRQPDDTEDDRHQRGDRGAPHAEGQAGAPAEDQERREDHVDGDGDDLHHIGVRKAPEPRSAAAIVASTNCSASAGMNHSR